jgi:hypothetical protein
VFPRTLNAAGELQGQEPVVKGLMGRRKVPRLFALRADLQGHLRPLPVGPPVQQMVQEFEEPPTPGLHLCVTVLGCRTQIGFLLFMQGRGLAHHLDAINR